MGSVDRRKVLMTITALGAGGAGLGLLDGIFGRGRANGGGNASSAIDEKLDDLREPAIWLSRVDGLRSKSRLGGLPSLPDGIDWPRHTQSGTPLHFLAQIDLSELPPTPLDPAIDDARLPGHGMLFFFADMEEEMLWDDRGGADAATRVIFARKPGAERQPPADIPQIGHAWGETSGGYARGTTVFSARGVKPYVIDTFAGVERYFQGGASKRGDELTLASIEKATGSPVPVITPKARRTDVNHHPAVAVESRDADGNVTRREIRLARHQMLGAATNVQGAANAARQAGHVLLLQLDSDYGVDPSYVFCDMGMAQFWIKPEDLAAGRFDRAWGSTEGG